MLRKLEKSGKCAEGLNIHSVYPAICRIQRETEKKTVNFTECFNTKFPLSTLLMEDTAENRKKRKNIVYSFKIKYYNR